MRTERSVQRERAARRQILRVGPEAGIYTDTVAGAIHSMTWCVLLLWCERSLKCSVKRRDAGDATVHCACVR